MTGRTVACVVWTLSVSALVPMGDRANAESDQAVLARGERVYAEKKCAMCHAIKGKGGKSGGDLTDVGAKRDSDWLKQFTRAPKSLIPNAKMPAFQGNQEDLDAVVAYMVSLK